MFYGDIPMHRSVQESQQCDLLCQNGENQQPGTNSIHIRYLCEMVEVRDGKVPMYISEYYFKGVCIRII
jgi:hypothetical protein